MKASIPEENKPEIRSNKKKKVRSIIEYFERIEDEKPTVNTIDVTMDVKAKEDSSDKVEVVEDGRIEKAVNAFNLLMRGGGTPKKTPGKKKKRYT